MSVDVPSLSIAVAVALAWLLLGLAGLVRPRSVSLVGRALFPIGALLAVLLALAAGAALARPAETLVLPVGLPDLPMHLRLDALSAFFLMLLGLASAGISLFAAGYFRSGEGTTPGLMGLQYHVFLAAMVLVLLADDAYAFLLGWEAMALASFFLVTTEHRIPEIRAAGFLYLLLAHVGAIAILLCFGVLQGGSWQFSFAAMRAAELGPGWAAAAFGLACFGFGAKAGIVPLHVWLPEAHPAAPSPVSALMSGVMLKTAVYGLLRVTMDLIGAVPWWWGAVLLGFGLFSALFGAVFAAIQSDMKRLLAYSSIENIGIVVAGIGLALVFQSVGMRLLAALSLAAALYHCLNHAMFKSLLFLVTGSVLHATRERSLGKLGGLIRRMPWVAGLGLVGTLAIAGLPPLNGFVSEWLLLQAFLASPRLPLPFANMVIPLGAALLALTAALAAYVMVKFYGVIFLGRIREPQLADAQDCGPLERLGLIWLASACVLLGLFPGAVLHGIGYVTGSLIGSAPVEASVGMLVLAPLSASRAAYAPVVFLVGLALISLLAVWVTRVVYRGRLRRSDPWDCGFPQQSARMQDTAEGFGQPIRHMFAPLMRMWRELPSPFDAAPRYRVRVEDRSWIWIYRPLASGVARLAERFGALQHGSISIYLLYSLGTLVFLLVLVL